MNLSPASDGRSSGAFTIPINDDLEILFRRQRMREFAMMDEQNNDRGPAIETWRHSPSGGAPGEQRSGRGPVIESRSHSQFGNTPNNQNDERGPV